MNVETNICRRGRWPRDRHPGVTALIARGYKGLLLAACISTHASDLLPPMTNGVPSEYAARRAGAEVGADRRIHITQEGLYRITHAGLLAAGITNPVGSNLRLFCRTQEIALSVSANGAWTTNDFAVFYGRPHDGYWTVTNTYWLGLGGTGLRMTQRNAAPQPGWPERATHWATVRYEPNNIYIPTYRPTDGSFDHWVAINVFNSGNTDLVISTPHPVSAGTAAVYLALWGRTAADLNPDHATRFSLNGANIQTTRYDGMNFHLATNWVLQGSLSNGANSIQLRQMIVSTTDTVSLEWMQVTYQASNQLIGGKLSFPGETLTNNYACGPWNTNETPWLLDIRQPHQPVRLINYEVSLIGATGQVRWADFATGTNRYWIASPTTLVDVAISPPVLFRDFSNTARRADYLIIAHGSLSTGAYQLARHRTRDGLRSLFVPIESVYDEFSYGIKDARAIKQLIGYAYHNWGIPPRFVLLVGDGSYDPQNHHGIATPRDYIPVYLDAAPFEYCVQDNWFGAVDGADFLADVAIGRFPFTTHSQVTSGVAKIIGFESAGSNASWRKRAILAADFYDSKADIDFRAASQSNVRSNLAQASFTMFNAYRDELSSTNARTVVTNNINSGVWAVSYFGHGTAGQWTDILHTGHVAQLQNTVWPIFTVMTCNNGAFANPTNECMAELLQERNQRGASATLSASALSVQAAADHYADGFYRHFTNAPPRTRLAAAIQSAQAELWLYSPNSQELLFYNLFGDPAQVVTP